MVSWKITTFATDFVQLIKFEIMKDIEPTKGEIVMYQPDETIRLEVLKQYLIRGYIVNQRITELEQTVVK